MAPFWGQRRYALDVDGDKNLDLMVLRLGENQLLRGDGQCNFSPPQRTGDLTGGQPGQPHLVQHLRQAKLGPPLR